MNKKNLLSEKTVNKIFDAFFDVFCTLFFFVLSFDVLSYLCFVVSMFCRSMICCNKFPSNLM